MYDLFYLKFQNSKNHMISLSVECKKVDLREVDSIMEVSRGWEN
jgi:hypothetical protein